MMLVRLHGRVLCPKCFGECLGVGCDDDAEVWNWPGARCDECGSAAEEAGHRPAGARADD